MHQVTNIDSVAPAPWSKIIAEARDLCRKEPLLDRLISRLILEADTLSHSIAIRLADLLHGSGIETEELLDLFVEVMSEELTIEAYAFIDLQAVFERDPACTTYLHALLNFKGFQALQAHRVAHQLWRMGRHELAVLLSSRVSLVLGPDIHPAARMGVGVVLDHGSGIVIGETAIVDDNVTILQNVTLGGTGKHSGDRHPKVREGVMLGAGAKVLGNVEIGAFSKVAAGSIVLKNVPHHCTVAGIPAQIVRFAQYLSEPYCEEGSKNWVTRNMKHFRFTSIVGNS